MSKLPDLQSAVRRIDGVASATVRWPDPHGPATLRVEFAPDADRATVTELVIATLREIAGVDVDDIRLDMHPGSGAPGPAHAIDGAAAPTPAEPAAPASTPMTSPEAEPAAPDAAPAAREPDGGTAGTAGGNGDHSTPVSTTATFSDAHSPAAHGPGAAPNGRARPVFSGMTVDRGDLDTRVQVTLAVGSSAYTGMAEGLATRRSAPRTAATATLSALSELLPVSLRVQLEWLDVIEPTETGRPSVVQAAVTCLSRAGEEVFIGTAIVRSDLREAAVRATLDALNRQLFRWREAEQVSVSA